GNLSAAPSPASVHVGVRSRPTTVGREMVTGAARDRDLDPCTGRSSTDLVRGVLVSRPFGQAVIDVDDALRIEDMAGPPDRFGDLAGRAEFEQCRDREPHAAAFIGERRTAKRAAHLARRHAPGPVEHAAIEAEMLDPAGYSDMALVEDRGPLHWCTVQCLAGPAV